MALDGKSAVLDFEMKRYLFPTAALALFSLGWLLEYFSGMQFPYLFMLGMLSWIEFGAIRLSEGVAWRVVELALYTAVFFVSALLVFYSGRLGLAAFEFVLGGCCERIFGVWYPSARSRNRP